jgi:AcrR family transcriptional regulator
MTDDTRGPRERMVYSAAQLVRTQGVAATGVRQVVERAGAPRGSFQHHFPGGKDQLVGEALLWAGDFAAHWVAAYPRTTSKPTPGGLFAHLVKQWKDEFTTRGYERGCPVFATTADLAGSDSAVNEPLRAALDRWEEAVVTELARMTIPRRRARRLATLMLSTLEGAIMAARVRRDVAPLTTVVAELSPVLNATA